MEEILTRPEINNFINSTFKDQNLSNKYKTLKKSYISIYDSIIFNTIYLPFNCKFNERLYHILNDLYSIPLCFKCSIKEVSFRGLYSGYYTFCSKKCSIKNN